MSNGSLFAGRLKPNAAILAPVASLEAQPVDHAHDPDHKTEPKNPVVCRDESGNEISQYIFNVLNLACCQRKAHGFSSLPC